MRDEAIHGSEDVEWDRLGSPGFSPERLAERACHDHNTLHPAHGAQRTTISLSTPDAAPHISPGRP